MKSLKKCMSGRFARQLSYVEQMLSTLMSFLKLEIRFVERDICPIVSVHNERTVPIIMTGCMAHA